MTTIKEIIKYLESKSNKECQPSMDGSREKYYQGRNEAYLECANILRKYLEQEMDEQELNKIAEEDCIRMLNKKVCYADDIFEFYKMGYRNALGGSNNI